MRKIDRAFTRKNFQKIALGLLFSGFLTFSLSGNSYALDRFLAGTHGNGIPIGGKTVEEAKAYLEGEYSQNYVLYLKGREKTEEISGKEIGYRLQAATNLSEILQKEAESGEQGSPDRRIDFSLEGSTASYDTVKLKEKLEALSMVKDAKETRTATVIKENGVYTIVPEQEGNSLNWDRLWARVERALQRGENTILLSDEGIYEEITHRKADLEGKVEAMNKLSSVSIVTNILGNLETLTGEQLQELVTGVNAQGLSFDEDKLLAYAQSLENKYGNAGNTASSSNLPKEEDGKPEENPTPEQPEEKNVIKLVGEAKVNQDVKLYVSKDIMQRIKFISVENITHFDYKMLYEVAPLEGELNYKLDREKQEITLPKNLFTQSGNYEVTLQIGGVQPFKILPLTVKDDVEVPFTAEKGEPEVLNKGILLGPTYAALNEEGDLHAFRVTYVPGKGMPEKPWWTTRLKSVVVEKTLYERVNSEKEFLEKKDVYYIVPEDAETGANTILLSDSAFEDKENFDLMLESENPLESVIWDMKG